MGIFAVEGGAAAVEGVDGGDGALGAKGFLAEAGEVSDGDDADADFGACGPVNEGGESDIELLRQAQDAEIRVEEGGEDAVLEFGGDGSGGEEAADSVLEDGFVRLGERIVGGPRAGEGEVF